MRRYLVFVSALMVFWMILREVKYRFIINPDAERYLWYMYYIPILVTPMIALFVSVLPGKSEADRLPGWSSFFYLPTVILILLFLTNDLHQWAFCFPKEASVWTEHGKYRYGIVFYLAIVWGVFCSLTAMTIMILKSRLPKLHGFFWLPFVPIVVVMIYVVAYALRVPMVAELGDIAAFESLLFTAFLQMLLIFLAEDFPVCCRRESFLLLEKPAEVECIFISDHRSYVGNIIIGSFQKHLRISDPCGKYIFHRCCSYYFLKALIEPAGAYMP